MFCDFFSLINSVIHRNCTQRELLTHTHFRLSFQRIVQNIVPACKKPKRRAMLEYKLGSLTMRIICLRTSTKENTKLFTSIQQARSIGLAHCFLSVSCPNQSDIAIHTKRPV